MQSLADSAYWIDRFDGTDRDLLTSDKLRPLWLIETSKISKFINELEELSDIKSAVTKCLMKLND